MATLTVTASYASWYYLDSQVYATTHNATSAGYAGAEPVLGQDFFTPTYRIYRAGLFFDTSSILSSAIISTAILSLYGLWDDSTTADFDLTVVNGSALNNPRVVADYGGLLTATISGGTINSSLWSLSGYNDITLNSTGISFITKAGTTKLGLRSSRDINSNAPTGMENVEAYGVDVTYPAKLTITYIDSGEGAGAYAVVEKYWYYIDAYGTHRYIEGKVAG